MATLMLIRAITLTGQIFEICVIQRNSYDQWQRYSVRSILSCYLCHSPVDSIVGRYGSKDTVEVGEVGK